MMFMTDPEKEKSDKVKKIFWWEREEYDSDTKIRAGLMPYVSEEDIVAAGGKGKAGSSISRLRWERMQAIKEHILGLPDEFSGFSDETFEELSKKPLGVYYLYLTPRECTRLMNAGLLEGVFP